MNTTAPSKEPPLTSHEYDGIREYDNPTPGWWYGIFVGSIVFSVLYAIFWHGSIAGYTIQQTWEDDQRAEFDRIFGGVGNLGHDEATILTQMGNPKFMIVAKSIFIGNCASCHTRDGGGDVGVNLCDESYKNVEKIADIFKVISEGANSGAMPSWKNRLTENERVIMASYIASLRGTKPASPKAAEGKVIPAWPPAPPTPPATPK